MEGQWKAHQSTNQPCRSVVDLSHDVDHQGSPAGEGMAPPTGAGRVVVLLPEEPFPGSTSSGQWLCCVRRAAPAAIEGGRAGEEGRQETAAHTHRSVCTPQGSSASGWRGARCTPSGTPPGVGRPWPRTCAGPVRAWPQRSGHRSRVGQCVAIENGHSTRAQHGPRPACQRTISAAPVLERDKAEEQLRGSGGSAFGGQGVCLWL